MRGPLTIHTLDYPTGRAMRHDEPLRSDGGIATPLSQIDTVVSTPGLQEAGPVVCGENLALPGREGRN